MIGNKTNIMIVTISLWVSVIFLLSSIHQAAMGVRSTDYGLYFLNSKVSYSQGSRRLTFFCETLVKSQKHENTYISMERGGRDDFDT